MKISFAPTSTKRKKGSFLAKTAFVKTVAVSLLLGPVLHSSLHATPTGAADATFQQVNPLSMLGRSHTISKEWRKVSAQQTEPSPPSDLLGAKLSFLWSKASLNETACSQPNYTLAELSRQTVETQLHIPTERLNLQGDSFLSCIVECGGAETLRGLTHYLIDSKGTVIGYTPNSFYRLSPVGATRSNLLPPSEPTKQVNTIANSPPETILPQGFRDTLLLKAGIEPEQLLKTLKKMQDAIRANNRWAVAKSVQYPLYVPFQHELVKVTSRSQFVKLYDSIMTPQISDNILNIESKNLMAHERGVLLGQGIWISPACTSSRCTSKTLKFSGLG